MDANVEDIVRSAQAGDAEAFAQLIRRYERTALAVAYSMLGSADRAGDVAQEAFIRAWRKLASLKEPGRFGPWLTGIVRNLALDEHRRARPAGEEPKAQLACTSSDPATALGQNESRRQLTDAISQLDEVSRSAVMLRYYEGLSSRQIGELLEMTPAAVDMRLSRARGELKEMLAPLEIV